MEDSNLPLYTYFLYLGQVDAERGYDERALEPQFLARLALCLGCAVNRRRAPLLVIGVKSDTSCDQAPKLAEVRTATKMYFIGHFPGEPIYQIDWFGGEAEDGGIGGEPIYLIDWFGSGSG